MVRPCFKIFYPKARVTIDFEGLFSKSFCKFSECKHLYTAKALVRSALSGLSYFLWMLMTVGQQTSKSQTDSVVFQI